MNVLFQCLIQLGSSFICVLFKLIRIDCISPITYLEKLYLSLSLSLLCRFIKTVKCERVWVSSLLRYKISL
jgi:hypothetical protein